MAKEYETIQHHEGQEEEEEEGAKLEYLEMDSDSEKKLASCLCICCGSVNVYTKAVPPGRGNREAEESEGAIVLEPPAQVMKDKKDARKQGKERLSRRKVLGLI